MKNVVRFCGEKPLLKIVMEILSDYKIETVTFEQINNENFKNNNIILFGDSNLEKKIDNDRENLIKFLRLELQNDLIELEVIVDKSTSKEYYSTPQEKFEKLNKINPLLDQFKKDLKLDL